MSSELVQVAHDNLEYFKKAKFKNRTYHEFCKLFESLIKTVAKIHLLINNIKSFAPDYDLDKMSPGNGYRSFIDVYESAADRTLKLCFRVKESRESIFFRKTHYEKELAAYGNLLEGLHKIAECLVENQKKSRGSSLYTEEGIFNNAITKTMDSIKLEYFHGRVSEFHFPSSLKIVIKGLAVLMTTYSEYYFSLENKFLKLLRLPFTALKYFFNPEMLSERLVAIHKNVEVGFWKSMYKLQDTIPFMLFQEIVEPKVGVNYAFQINPEPLKVQSDKNGKLVDIPVPSSHIEDHPVKCRLFSKQKREGMVASKKTSKPASMSSCLLIHCHGGGWTFQTSRTHGMYLKKWAERLDIPILSIDYSLSPKAPFPRAVEEVFYAYCWVLNNHNQLGTTGENIVLVGDSAGANLMISCVIKCIEMGIKRPKAIYGIYSALMLDHVMAPSRFLGFFDVILPYKTYLRCFNAYNDKTNNQMVTESGKIPILPENEFDHQFPKNYLMTPHLAPDEILREFPTSRFLSTNMDPCLDESVEFAKRLKSCEVNVQLELLEGLNHGFLNLSIVSKESHQGVIHCMRKITELLELN